MRIEVPRAFTHDKAHRVATEVEEKVKKAVGDSSVLVHVDAVKSDDETILDRIRLIAFETEGIRNVHSIYLSDMSSFSTSNETAGGERRVLHLYLDIQMDGNLDLKTAHSLVDSFEKRVKAEIPEVKEITSHIETEASENLAIGTERADVDREYMERIRRMVLSVNGVTDCKNIGITTVGGETHITLTIILSNADSRRMTIQEAHRIATNVQNVIVKQTGAARVIVHEEPL
jgi:divalent metal cation (Fe/Co/Zn/Cd) transporter